MNMTRYTEEEEEFLKFISELSCQLSHMIMNYDSEETIELLYEYYNQLDEENVVIGNKNCIDVLLNCIEFVMSVCEDKRTTEQVTEAVYIYLDSRL